MITSLPKAGTNLLSKILETAGMTRSRGLSLYRANSLRYLPGSLRMGVDSPTTTSSAVARALVRLSRASQFGASHLPYSSQAARTLRGVRVLAQLRSPADVAISLVEYVRRMPQHHLHPYMHGPDAYHLAVHGQAGLLLPLRERYQSIAHWQQAGALVVHFEDVVGPEGGGDRAAQLDTIDLILRHMDLKADAETVAATLFGGTTTFNKGRIGRSAEVLPPALLRECSAIADAI